MKTQGEVLKRLELENRTELRKMENAAMRELAALWKKAKSDIASHILYEYHKDFGSQKWNRPEALKRGTMFRINHLAKQRLSRFRQEGLSHVKKTLSNGYTLSVARHVWALDQVTPPNVSIKHPSHRRYREAEPSPISIRGMVNILTGPKAETAIESRWSGWLDAYESSLYHNINLGALNGSSAGDAADEVDATRAGSPSYDLDDVFDRLFRTEFIGAGNAGAEDVADSNDNLIDQEVWTTWQDERVCPDCDGNEGLTLDETTDDIPLHPLCRCAWQLVPQKWIDMVDNQMRSEMDEEDLPDDAMVIRHPVTGKLVGYATVSFDDWSSGKTREAVIV